MPVSYLILKILYKLKLGNVLYPLFQRINKLFINDTLPNIRASKLLLCHERSHSCHVNDISCGIKNINKCHFYDLQIIIPVYNSEKYIMNCLNSILSQRTKYTFQIIVINDGSTDNTGDILKLYKKNPLVKIINQQNLGISAARNTGLRFIHSTYIMFVDSDDELDSNAIQNLLNNAYKYNSDISIGGYTIFLNRYNKTHQVKYSFNSNVHMKSSDDYDGYVWGKIIKSSLFNDIRFPSGYEFEDTIMAFWLYPRCRKICSINKNVYLHRNNINGISHRFKFTNISIDSFWITRYILNKLPKYHITINEYIYNSFLSQVKMNCMRNSFISTDIQKSIFVLTCALYTKYFINFNTNINYYKPLETSLNNKDYKSYILFCLLK